MPRKISYETIELMQRLYNDRGLLVTEVAKIAEVPYKIAYYYTRNKERLK